MTSKTNGKWHPKGVEFMEPSALQAINDVNSCMCVIASAGAGKTEFLAQKATYLLETGVCRPPFRILAISFKKDAADSLQERLIRRCPSLLHKRFDSVTFDAFTKGLLDKFRKLLKHPYDVVADYDVFFPKNSDFRSFLNSKECNSLSEYKFANLIQNTKFPIRESTLEHTEKKILSEYWKNYLNSENGCKLSFQMINRLSEYLLRSNPKVLRALRMTYPFVLLDEFQDTTKSQYEVLNTSFLGSLTRVTAVGDNKQRIMGWAGAMENGFGRFIKDYNAKKVDLEYNWRSNSKLVSIQHCLAKKIQSDTVKPIANRESEIEGNVSAVWNYKTTKEEISGLTNWIVSEISKNNLRAEEFSILVRFNANDVEKQFLPFFRNSGLKLRNLSRTIGTITIQDLLTEKFTDIVLKLLKLGAVRKEPDAWASTKKILTDFEGISIENEAQLNIIDEKLSVFVKKIRTDMKNNQPSPDSCKQFFESSLSFLNEDLLHSSLPQLERLVDYERVKNGFLALLIESAENTASWKEVLEKFIGKDHVQLMTIHKSKGLEFHTMIFLGFDNETWWSMDENNIEEFHVFFVAFTRAKERSYFTFCEERGNSIAWLIEFLKTCQVVRIPGPT